MTVSVPRSSGAAAPMGDEVLQKAETVLVSLRERAASKEDAAKLKALLEKYVALLEEDVVAAPASEPTPEPEPTSAPAANLQPMGAVRPKPQFAPASTQTPPATPTETVAAPEVATTAAPEAPEVPVSAESEVSAPAAPVDASAAVETPAPTPDAAPVDHKARIMEIKHAVNERVGNPVTLIDAENNVGRNYMNALLEAMKLSNNGTPEEAAGAMQALEDAFKSVNEMLDANGGVVSAPAAEPTPVAEPAEVVAPPAEPAPVPEPIPAPAAAVEPAQAPEPTPTKVPVVTKVPMVDIHTTQSTVPEAEMPAQPEPAPVEPTPTPAAAEPTPDVPSTPASTIPAAAPASAAATTPPVMDPARAQAAAAATEDIADLNTPEVIAGVNQLLSEWGIFKASGFLGTGPSGAEHPLYQTLKDLPMVSVVSGRFEGVTPEITQTISDYMKGWQYEQGVVHTQGETFEHYLRRVVREILERAHQKKNSASA